MQLLDNGIGVQNKNWIVDQSQAAGFSRIYYIISGDITYKDTHIERKLTVGNMYVFPAKNPYLLTHTVENPINCLWFHMDIFPYDVDKILEFDITLSENKTLKALIEALSNESKFFGNKDSLYESLSQSLALLIIKHPAVKNIDSSIVEILSYLRENIYSPDLNVISISKHFGYSTSHFIRLFKSNMNTTPHQYITVLRMSAAAKLILEGHNIFETANLCGYTDVKTFSRVFKNTYNIPPSVYNEYYYPKA